MTFKVPPLDAAVHKHCLLPSSVVICIALFVIKGFGRTATFPFRPRIVMSFGETCIVDPPVIILPLAPLLVVGVTSDESLSFKTTTSCAVSFLAACSFSLTSSSSLSPFSLDTFCIGRFSVTFPLRSISMQARLKRK